MNIKVFRSTFIGSFCWAPFLSCGWENGHSICFFLSVGSLSHVSYLDLTSFSTNILFLFWDPVQESHSSFRCYISWISSHLWQPLIFLFLTWLRHLKRELTGYSLDWLSIWRANLVLPHDQIDAVNFGPSQYIIPGAYHVDNANISGDVNHDVLVKAESISFLHFSKVVIYYLLLLSCNLKLFPNKTLTKILFIIWLLHPLLYCIESLNGHSMYAKSLQSCLTLCDPIDSSPPGSSVPGILQARILEWVAISFSLSGHCSSVYLTNSKALVSLKHLTLLASSLKLSFCLPYITLSSLGFPSLGLPCLNLFSLYSLRKVFPRVLPFVPLFLCILVLSLPCKLKSSLLIRFIKNLFYFIILSAALYYT